MSINCIGLFGTCGKSTWRQNFIKTYQEEGIIYYNPQLPDGTWTPDCAKEEALHLATDSIILFPVLSETYGVGSLAETGYSINQALKFDNRRDFIILIDEDIDPSLKESNPALAKESRNTRALVRSHLQNLYYDNVYLVNNLEKMLHLSILIWKHRIEKERFFQE